MSVTASSRVLYTLHFIFLAPSHLLRVPCNIKHPILNIKSSNYPGGRQTNLQGRFYNKGIKTRVVGEPTDELTARHVHPGDRAQVENNPDWGPGLSWASTSLDHHVLLVTFSLSTALRTSATKSSRLDKFLLVGDPSVLFQLIHDVDFQYAGWKDFVFLK